MIKIQDNTEKTLWETHGKWALFGLAAFLVTYSGFQYYSNIQHEKLLKASAIQDHLLLAIQKKDVKQIVSDAEHLTSQYPKTPYAGLAHLQLAKMAVDKQDLPVAMAHLRAAMQGNEKKPIGQVATVRLARVLIDLKRYDEALGLVVIKTIPNGYAALFEETKGDIYVLQNQTEKAKVAYETAIHAISAPGIPVARLQLKLSKLPIKEGV